MSVKELEFKFAGIDFLVEARVDDEEQALTDIEAVYTWNEEEHKYEPLSVKLDSFAEELKDQIEEALTDMYDSERARYEDAAYDAWRDDQLEKKLMEDSICQK